MPGLTPPECPRYIAPPPTRLDLEFADLAIIDLSKAHTPEGRAELAAQLRDALRTNGFVYAINHGYTQTQRDRVFDIADVPFTAVPPEEMKIYTANIDKVGYYAGYKGRQYWKVDAENGVLDQIEHYGLNRIVTKCPHPQALRPFLPELDAFARHNHFNILHPILRLIALSLELPEETLVEKHSFDRHGETSGMFMKYYRRTDEEEEKSKNVWLKGHTDIGSVTILWSQPISGLQILSPDGKWKWVRHIDNALVINTGDMMDFFTGGFYKPTIHRVVQPPVDQNACDRLGAFYFTMADDDVRLLPLAHSPLLQRVGIERRCPDEEAPLSEVWRKGRTTTYGRSELKKGSERDVEEEVIEGIVVKHYN
ncbi:Clavaminate synthase-like protein [Gyrodon lividus]|nr:Clavaminate synthase-like protein [Gyrodon lividus]